MKSRSVALMFLLFAAPCFADTASDEAEYKNLRDQVQSAVSNGKFEQAAEIGEKSLQLNKKLHGSNAAEVLQEMYANAFLYIQAGSYDKARQIFDDAFDIAINPVNGKTPRKEELLQVMVDAGNAFRRAQTSDDPLKPSIALVQAEHFYTRAISYLEGLNDRTYDLEQAYFSAGRTAFLRQDYKGAQSYFQKALEIDADLAKAKADSDNTQVRSSFWMETPSKDDLAAAIAQCALQLKDAAQPFPPKP